jgi:hypothetical protein
MLRLQSFSNEHLQSKSKVAEKFATFDEACEKARDPGCIRHQYSPYGDSTSPPLSLNFPLSHHASLSNRGISILFEDVDMADCTEGLRCPVKLSREEKRKGFEHDPTNAQDTLQSLRDGTMSLSVPYFSHQVNVEQIGEHLRDLWDELIHIAKIIPASSSEHDRMVTLILEARELGTFVRQKKDASFDEEREEAVLPNGQRLWTDLPYLVQEFQGSWTNESMTFTATQRESLAVLTAKLCAVGVCPNELSYCALWLFRETLEVHRPLAPSSREGGDSKYPHPTVIDLLPANLAWLRHGKFKLAKLSVAHYDPSPAVSDDNVQVLTAPGDLATKANFLQNGFGVARWLFWRQRFKELSGCGDERVAKLAKACFEEAVLTGLHVGLDIPGEKKYLSNLFKALDRELIARGMIGSVGPEDIEIDMDWADEKKAVYP